MRALMVQGVSSSAGKSLVATALCRRYAHRGVRVAPFKAQNMSNNARVAGDGEIGAAQHLQALAAGVEPDSRMNPVLVKPEGQMRSQVVVRGRVDRALSGMPWRERPRHLWPAIEAALRSLAADHDLLVIEGAGSPAEINLSATDLANMRTARAAGAAVLLVADIDRGGAFAHLHGTWALLEPDDRRRVRGFALNRFRGDPALLPPAPERLAALTGIPVVGVLPWLDHDLPDEDGAGRRAPGTSGPDVAVVAYPTASNLDELRPLEGVARVRAARDPEDVGDADLVILPGSKCVAADLAWLRRRGLAGALTARARSGAPIIGICGGMQMLGLRLEDPAGVDGAGGGLGLLPLRTVFAAAKTVRRRTARFGALADPWRGLSGLAIDGYEIRHGRTVATGPAVAALGDGLGWARGPVLGIALHGVLEDPAVLAALVGAAPPRTLEATFELLADAVEEHLDMRAVDRWVGL